MKIDRNSRNQVLVIVAYSGEGVVLPCRPREWGSTLDVHQRREFPVVDEQRCKAGELEVALGNNDDIFDVPEIRATRPVIPRWVVGVLYVGASVVALRVREAEALRPGVIGQKTEGGREPVRDGGYESIVVSHSVVIGQDGSTSTPRVLLAWSRVRNG